LTLGKIARFPYENYSVSIHSFRMNTNQVRFAKVPFVPDMTIRGLAGIAPPAAGGGYFL
jgi:hypothetical protein